MGWIRDNGLTITLLAASSLSIGAMGLTGWAAFNEQLATHGGAPLRLGEYLITGSFISAVFENWESEFLQMGAYVTLTAFLFQRGSSESRDPDGDAADRERCEPLARTGRLGAIGAWLYSYSLGLALGLLFVLSFVLHLLGSHRASVDEAALHGQPAHSLIAHLADAEFWFESFQNWQSEFLSTAVLVVLSIFLRFYRSPESKPVNAGASETG